MLRKLLFLLLLLTAGRTGWAHAYHASIMDVRYNVQKQQLEIALKVFTDDFEAALSAGRPVAVSLDQSPKPLVTQLTTALLRGSLVLSSRPGETLPLLLIGIQKENDAHWLYCTVKLARPLTGFTLRHTLLLATYPDQMNIVNVEAGGKKQSLLFRDDEREQRIIW
ncbi:MAG: hypothetical protein H7Z21_09295 [Hymenobacter sp.]|nr:hypothetical protein [Hymenobacter sp.]